MKRLAFVLLAVMAMPAIADPDPDDTTDQPAKKPKKKKKKKKKKPDDAAQDKKKPDEIEMDDPTKAPPPVAVGVGVDASTTVDAQRDPNAAAMAPVTGPVAVNPTPVEITKRPLVAQLGRLELGAYLMVPRGPDYESTTANDPIGKWIGFDLHAEYGAVDKLAVGLDIQLAPLTSDSPSTDDATSKIGGFVASAKYSLIDGRATDPDPLQLAGHVTLGLLKRGAPALGPFSFPLYGPDLEPAIGLGVALQKTFLQQKLALIADPHLFFQASGHQSIDATTMMQVEDLLITLELPVYVTYQAAPNISIGGRTGIYTGQKFSFSPSDNLDIPLVAEGVYTAMKNQLDIGVDLGLGNLTPRGTDTIVDSFVLGIFATYRTK